MTTADTQAEARQRRSRRAMLGIAAQVLGIAGGVLIVLLIVGLWLGRGWLADRGNALTAAADEQVTRVVIVSELVSGRLNDVALRVEEYEAEARSIAADTSATAQRLEGLRTRLGPLATRYTDARDQFVAIRERVMSVVESVQRLDRLVPAIELPGTITGALEDIDGLLVRLDTAITGLSATGETIVDVNAFATARADGAAALAQGLRDAQGVVDSLQDGAVDVEERLLTARSTVAGWIDLTAFGLTLFLLYLVFLHAALWYLGRRLRAD
jgi:hypothetical protein